MIKANDTSLKSWVEVLANSDFPIQNLPFGIIKPKNMPPRMAVRIGDYALDLAALAGLGMMDLEDKKLNPSLFLNDVLNPLMSLGKMACRSVRNRLSEILEESNAELRDNAEAREKVLYKIEDIEALMPVRVGDYTDFYSSIEHATNVGTMFRGADNALMPNWKHIPVGYHGRASSIVVSGTDFHRPKGQTKADDADMPSFGPTRLMDFELEMAFITGGSTALGDSISTNEAEDFIFGLALFNDWSARDIQKWEYVPLGPFLGKNFASSISPWIVTLDALDPFRVDGPVQDPKVLPYLQSEGKKNYDIQLEVYIQPEGGEPHRVSLSNFKYMYWNMVQQLAHHSVNGCNIKTGDILASGTISGPTPDSYGSMLELSWRGSKPIQMPDGTERKFLLDGDTLIIKGWGEKDGVRVGFGEVRGKVLPTK